MCVCVCEREREREKERERERERDEAHSNKALFSKEKLHVVLYPSIVRYIKFPTSESLLCYKYNITQTPSLCQHTQPVTTAVRWGTATATPAHTEYRGRLLV